MYRRRIIDLQPRNRHDLFMDLKSHQRKSILFKAGISIMFDQDCLVREKEGIRVSDYRKVIASNKPSFIYDSIQKTALKAYKNKDQVDKKYKLLKNIFTNKTLIEKNDSLFAICALEPKQRTDKIYEVLDLELAKNSGVDFLAYNNQTNIEFIRDFSGPSFKDYSQLTKSDLI